ncbi:MAG: SpoIIE family protein phosphatase [Candidatus Bathyarchaeia archaeon]
MAVEIEKSHRGFAIGVATRPAAGIRVNGDAFLIKEWSDHVLVALIDGLGHGEEAAKASGAAREYVNENFALDIKLTLMGLHEQLSKTRGAAVGLARIDQAEHRFTFCGVGNIEIRVKSNPPIHPTSFEGIVGMNKISPRKLEYQYSSIKAIVIHSDGISGRFDLSDYSPYVTDPRETAEAILSDWWSGRDDATIIVLTGEETHQ